MPRRRTGSDNGAIRRPQRRRRDDGDDDRAGALRRRAWHCAGAAVAQPQPGQVNVICSVQADWCNMIQTVFTKSTGIKVIDVAQGLRARRSPRLIAEKANPKTRRLVRRHRRSASAGGRDAT